MSGTTIYVTDDFKSLNFNENNLWLMADIWFHVTEDLEVLDLCGLQIASLWWSNHIFYIYVYLVYRIMDFTTLHFDANWWLMSVNENFKSSHFDGCGNVMLEIKKKYVTKDLYSLDSDMTVDLNSLHFDVSAYSMLLRTCYHFPLIKEYCILGKTTRCDQNIFKCNILNKCLNSYFMWLRTLNSFQSEVKWASRAWILIPCKWGLEINIFWCKMFDIWQYQY